MSDEPTLADQLRARACPAGLPHTGDDPASDHGHTDCWLFHRAADALDAYEWVEQRADRRIADLEAEVEWWENRYELVAIRIAELGAENGELRRELAQHRAMWGTDD